MTMDTPERIFGLETEYIFSGYYGPEDQRRWDSGMGQYSRLGTIFSDAMDHLPAGVCKSRDFYNNGSRIYWDGHPEASGAEAKSIADVVSQDRANERLILAALRAAVKSALPKDPLALRDFKLTRRVVTEETSQGRHENYLVAPEIFDTQNMGYYLNAFTAFKALASPLTGLGYVHRSSGTFYMGQKMSRVTTDYHADTVHTKPLINTRNEPHARDYRRLHVVGVDPTSPAITAMSLGVGSLLLRLSEMGRQPRLITPGEWSVLGNAANADLTFSKKYPISFQGKAALMTITDFHDNIAESIGKLVDKGACTAEEAACCDEYVFLNGQIKKAKDFIDSYSDPAEKKVAQDVAIGEHLAPHLDWANKYSCLTGYWNRIPDDKKGPDIFSNFRIAEIDIKLDLVGTSTREGLVQRLYKQPKAEEWAPAALVEKRMREPPAGRPRVRSAFIEATVDWPGGVTVDWGYLSMREVANAAGGHHTWALTDPYDEQRLPEILKTVKFAQHNPQTVLEEGGL